MSAATTTPAKADALGGGSLPARTRRRLSTPWASIAAIAIAVLWTVPTFGLLLSSFRPENDIKETGWWTFFAHPALTFQNYIDVLTGGSTGDGTGLSDFFINSVVITVPSVLFSLLLGSIAAYALSWIDWKGRDIAFIAVFALQVVPLQLALIPMLQIFSTWWPFSLMDPQGITKFVNIWIAHVTFGMPLVTFLLHNFMSGLPREVMESARVDGAGHARIYRSIIMPLIVPAVAAVGIFQFLYIWNDLLVGLVFGTPATNPIMVAVANLAGSRGEEWQRLTSGAFVGMVVPLIVFFSLQRYFVRGLLAGSVKG